MVLGLSLLYVYFRLYPDTISFCDRAHVKCGEGAPRDCGIRVTHKDGQQPTTLPASTVPLDAVSLLSKMKQDISHTADGTHNKLLPGKRR